MAARKPFRAQEPNCVHSHPEYPQPASACRICKDSDFLREHAEEWEAWLAENPDSPEARVVAEMDRSGRYEPILDRFREGQ